MANRYTPMNLRRSISEPPPQIREAAQFLDAACTAHLMGNRQLAEQLIRLADMPELYAWLKPIWADSDAHVIATSTQDTVSLESGLRAKTRMPTAQEKRLIHERDGYNCRFCDIPVIRPEVRARITYAYPQAARWGRKESEQHAAFQVMWAQYDHILPHAKGGTNDLENIVLACAACNFGRGAYLLEEVGVMDPRTRTPLAHSWDGLERFQ